MATYRTFEGFFIAYMADKLGQAMNTVIKDESIAVGIDDREFLSSTHQEATFQVVCKYRSKKQADEALAAAEDAITQLPWENFKVMRASLLAQDVDTTGAPRDFTYTGSFLIRFHTERSYSWPA